jgi:hypothetical protein
MLHLILMITFCAPDLGAVERAYTQVLHYSVVDHGKVTAAEGATWGAPAMRGHSYLVMHPASDANVYLRFIQADEGDPYRPMSTFGWNATEYLVQDPYALAHTIREPGTGFSLVGEPRPLGANSPIHAMQAVGPAQEVVYLTRVPEGGRMPSATTAVDRPFVIILGTPDLSKTQQFLHDRLGMDSGAPVQARMTVLNKAFGLDIETTHPLAMTRLSPEYAIELDQYPDAAVQRPHRKGELPPAMSLVTFETDSLESVRDLLLAPPRRIKHVPYNGRKVGTIRGSAGELMELVESEPNSAVMKEGQ